MTTAWRMAPALLVRRAAVEVRERGRFRLLGRGSNPAARGDVEVPVVAIADWLEESAALLERGDAADAAAAVAFAEALRLEIAHEPVVSPRRLSGGRRTGTELACTCGDRFGVVSQLAPSRGGREAATEHHAVHARHVQGIDEVEFQRRLTQRRSRQQEELWRLRESRPEPDPWADRPWERPARQDWRVRVTGRLRTAATAGTVRRGLRHYPAGSELTLVMSGRAGTVPVLDSWDTEEDSALDVVSFVVEVVQVLAVLEETSPWPDRPDLRLVPEEMLAEASGQVKEPT